jgi:uncharacterized protein (TIGR02246 family)
MPADTPEQIHAYLSAAFNRGDVEAFLDIYEPEALLLVPPGGQEARGEAAIRAAIEPIFAARPEFESRVVAKLESNGLALTQARWRSVATIDGKAHEESGHGTVVSRRQPGGGWRIVLDNPLGPG